MVKKMVIPTPKPDPTPVPAPARITIGQKILARMDELFAHATTQNKRLTDLEAQVWTVTRSIEEVSKQLHEVEAHMERLEVVALSARDNASAAEVAAEDAIRGVEKLAERMPDVEEVVDNIRSRERIEWLASLKPAF